MMSFEAPVKDPMFITSSPISRNSEDGTTGEKGSIYPNPRYCWDRGSDKL
jgi:hypothetical protein